LGPPGSHEHEILLCDAQFLCDPSFQFGETKLAQKGTEEIRVDVVWNIERLACVRRVDFKVHGGQCILCRDMLRQTWVMAWALILITADPRFVRCVTCNLTRQNLIPV